MTIDDMIDSCYRADLTAPGTAGNLQHLVIPALQREAIDLANTRQLCQAKPEWAADWRNAGLEDLEQRIHEAVLEGMARLAFDADPNPLDNEGEAA